MSNPIKKTQDSARTDDVAAGVAQLRTDLAEVIDEARSLLAGVAHETTRRNVNRAKDTYGQSVEQLRDGVGYATERVSHLVEEASTEIRRHPFATLGITLGVGLIVGSLLTLTGRHSR